VGRIRFALKWCAAWLSSLRDFVVLHTVLMFLAIICAHVGGALSRKGRPNLMKYRGAAIAYTISLLLMLSGIPWWRPLLRLGS
jgi:hypothetical protein